MMEFSIDLTGHEVLRRTMMREAMPDDWDEVQATIDARTAYDTLYSGLDEQQQLTYEMLAAAGVLPPRE